MREWIRQKIEKDKRESEDWLKTDTYFRANLICILGIATGFLLGMVIGGWGNVTSIIIGYGVFVTVMILLGYYRRIRDKRLLPQEART